MAWHDVGFILFAIVCAVAGIALVIFLVGLIVASVPALWTAYKPAGPRIEAETPLGRFAKRDDEWDFVGEAPLSITVNDLDGIPDPKFVAKLPRLLQKLPGYERLARKAYDFEEAKDGLELESEPFALFGLNQGSENVEFVLTFGAEDEAEDLGTVFISFNGGRVVDGILVH